MKYPGNDPSLLFLKKVRSLALGSDGE